MNYRLYLNFSAWMNGPLGSYIYGEESKILYDELKNKTFDTSLQIGLGNFLFLSKIKAKSSIYLSTKKDCDIRSKLDSLPLKDNSFDFILLPHILEFSDVPQVILREAFRVLKPNGHLILLMLNPYSLWGLKKFYMNQSRLLFKRAVDLYKIKDWLKLLDLEIISGRMYLYDIPFEKKEMRENFILLQQIIERWLPIFCGGYFLHCKKNVFNMRLIKPKWDISNKKHLKLNPKF